MVTPLDVRFLEKRKGKPGRHLAHVDIASVERNTSYIYVKASIFGDTPSGSASKPVVHFDSLSVDVIGSIPSVSQ